MPIPALEIEARKAVSPLNGKRNGNAAVPTLWAERFAQRTQRMTSSVIRELLKLTEKPDVISFAGGLPAPEVFPFAEVELASRRRCSAQQGKTALQYAATEGYLPLRELLVRHMARYGIRVTPANVMITSGFAAGPRPHRQALREPRRPHPHRVAHLPGGPPGVERLPGRVPHRADRRRGPRRREARGPAPGRAEVPLHPPQLPEPGRRHPEPREAAAPRRARQPLRRPDRRGRPLRAAPLRGRAPAADRQDRRRVPRLRGRGTATSPATCSTSRPSARRSPRGCASPGSSPPRR